MNCNHCGKQEIILYQPNRSSISNYPCCFTLMVKKARSRCVSEQLKIIFNISVDRNRKKLTVKWPKLQQKFSHSLSIDHDIVFITQDMSCPLRYQFDFHCLNTSRFWTTPLFLALAYQTSG